MNPLTRILTLAFGPLLALAIVDAGAQPAAPRVVLSTSEGDITLELDAAKAPKTVENFLGYVKSGHYDGTIFHRVIDGFMIQGGDPLGEGYGGPGYEFADEFHPALRHDRPGIMSMANRGPNTNGGQFFITLAATPHLDDRHAVFGVVEQGMDVVRRIGATPTGPRDRPLRDVVIERVTISRT